jgi:glycosyltransferase involved in cell wall biosynthesis
MQLVYLSPLPWSSFEQRPHRFVQWFHATTGGSVLWIDPYPSRLPIVDDIFRANTRRQPICPDCPSWLTVKSVYSMPIEPLWVLSRLNVFFWRNIFSDVKHLVAEDLVVLAIGKPSKLAMALLKAFPFSTSLYDAMDNFPAFFVGISRNAFAVTELQIMQSVDKVLVSSTALHDKWSLVRPVILIKNASDVIENTAGCATSANDSRPVLGYVGTVAKWFDWDMVVNLAKANPHARIRIIGPHYTRIPDNLPYNIELLPECLNAEAIRAMQQFTIGLIPFKCNDLTESVDPIKYYEYRALGIPVISSSFGEMLMHNIEDEGLFLVDNEMDAAKVVEQVLSVPPQAEWIDSFRKANSWTNRFDSIGVFT